MKIIFCGMLLALSLLCSTSPVYAQTDNYQVGDWIIADNDEHTPVLVRYALCHKDSSIVLEQIAGSDGAIAAFQYELHIGDHYAPVCGVLSSDGRPARCPSRILLKLQNCIATFSKER